MIDEELLNIGKKLFKLCLAKCLLNNHLETYVDGHIRIGRVKKNGVPISESRLNEMNQHLLFLQRAGKPVKQRYQPDYFQLIDQGITFWAFDFKRDYRPLVRQTHKEIVRVELRITSSSTRLELRPLVAIRLWMQAIHKCLRSGVWLMAGSKELMPHP